MNHTFRYTLIASLTQFSLAALVFAAEPAALSVSTEAALAKLKEGNARFVRNKVSTAKPTTAKRLETARAQHPFAIVLRGADSRTSPKIIFDQNIGDVFVGRTAGNLVDAHAWGSIKYAVKHPGARLIVVLGHQRCGAVEAAMASDTAPGHVESLVRDIQPAVQAIKGKPGDATDLAIAENARLMADKIRTDAALGDLAKDVRVIPAVYNLDTGKVEWSKD